MNASFEKYGVMAGAELRRLKLVLRRKLDQEMLGNYRSAFRGQGLQFADLRPYVPGDEIKRIHWKASARTGHIFVKSFEESRQAKVLCCLDTSASMLQGAQKPKSQLARDFAALVSIVATSQGDAAGLCLFSDTIENWIPCAQRRAQSLRILNALCGVDGTRKKSDMSHSLFEVAKRLKTKHLIFIISDFHTPDFETSLRVLCKKHEVVFVFVEDLIEAEIPAVGLCQFRDLESGSYVEVDLGSPAVRRALAHSFSQHKLKMQEKAHRLGADFMAFNQNPAQALARLMARRASTKQRLG